MFPSSNTQVTLFQMLGRSLFYYFAEAESEIPLSHPLTVWLNGGPGCSSVGFGAFMENGPFQPGIEGLLIRNKYSWNSVSNMLYVESPIGVGFSYSNISSDYIIWNDTTTAQDNLQFLINWVKKFPKYRVSDLYLTGESYAGHYIPQLAALLLEYSGQRNNKPIKLKAIALGNSLLDIEISIDAGEFLWSQSHGVISEELLALKKPVCNDSRYFFERIHNNISKECLDMTRCTPEEVGNFTDVGDLIRPIYIYPQLHNQLSWEILWMHSLLRKFQLVIPALVIEYMHTLTLLQCKRHCMSKHLNLQLPGISALGHWNTRLTTQELTSFLSSENLGNGIPILLYRLVISGDQGSNIPLTQTRKIANVLAKYLQLTTFGKYGPWYDGLQVGGWSQSFGRLKSNKNITYLTFTSPSQALTLFKAFLRGLPPPRTNKI